MAIFHFHGQVISRSAGRSSIAAAAYRSGEKLVDERTELTHDFTKKEHDVFYKEILLPEGAKEWMKDRSVLWNTVEKIERRKDAQLAREFNIALPRELTDEQNKELARSFVQKHFVDRGMVADLCLHHGHPSKGDKGNKEGEKNENQPHLHVMVTMREITDEGFGQKAREWNAKELLNEWREAWAEEANFFLALNGHDLRIDHRTLADQGISLTPQKKIGPEISRIYESRMEEHERIARSNGERILEDPIIALEAITRQQSTFTHQDLARFINRHTVDAAQFQTVYDKVKGYEQVVFLGKDEEGRERFTTKEMLNVEQTMLDNTASLNREGHDLSKETIETLDSAVLDVSRLSDQQKDGLKHLVEKGDIKCLIGYAGTGKGYLLNEAREVWEREGYQVHGVTLSGIAAENLEGASGITSRTFASRSYYWDRGEVLGKKDVLVVDEAGMLGSRQMARIVEMVKNSGAKLALIGDPQQLQAIEAGAPFRAIAEQTGYLELTEIRRQHEGWQQVATQEFAKSLTQEALDRYDQNGFIHAFETQAVAKTALVEKWNESRLSTPEKTQIMLAYTRKDAQELNDMARDFRKQNHELGEDHLLQTHKGEQVFAEGDRIYFLKNDRSLGVMNGTLGTIQQIDREHLTVNLDKDDLTRDKADQNRQNEVTFNLERYNHITHGYAATIHKAQGVTVDCSYILASKYLDSHATYVGMSRHRESVNLFWSKEEFARYQDLVKTVSRDRSKDVTLDYLGMETTELKERPSYSEKMESFDRKINLGDIHHELKEFKANFERENPYLAKSVQREMEARRQEPQQKNQTKQPEKPQDRQDNFQERYESYKAAQDAQEMREEKLLKQYYDLHNKHEHAKEHGQAHTRDMANDRLDRGVADLSKDQEAMRHSEYHDKELLKDVNERNRAMEIRKEKELSLDREMDF